MLQGKKSSVESISWLGSPEKREYELERGLTVFLNFPITSLNIAPGDFARRRRKFFLSSGFQAGVDDLETEDELPFDLRRKRRRERRFCQRSANSRTEVMMLGLTDGRVASWVRHSPPKTRRIALPRPATTRPILHPDKSFGSLGSDENESSWKKKK